jgi:monoamine oxidase
MACGFVEGYHAAHADRMSTLALRLADGEQDDEGRQFRLAGGQDAIIEWLRSGLEPTRTELRLNTVVTHVQWSQRAVTVETRSREGHATDRIRASALVVTIPIGVWKAPRDQEGAIEFDPPLREKERALETLEAGHVVKIAFRFRERFWERDVNFIHTNDRFMPTWWTASPVRSPILTGWAGGRAAEAMLADGEDAMTDRGLDSLSRAWPIPRRRLDSLLAGTYHHNWQRDPYSRGAYSYAGVGGSNAHAVLGKPMQGTLFFAGEATSGDETGTVAGAIESGKRAARELIRTSK